MASSTVLLVARLAASNDEVEQNVDFHDFKVLGATNLDEVKAALAQGPIDHVIIGAGIELDARLEIVGEVFRTSDSTTVHMKDRAGGRASYLPFVRSVMVGIREYAKSQVAS